MPFLSIPPACPPPGPSVPRGKPRSTLARTVQGVLTAGLLTVASVALAGPVPWPQAPYSHFADNQKLESVLGDFAGSFSLSLSLAPGISGLVNGKFTTASPTEFMSKLAGVYGFVWYTHAGTLFISKASDLTTRSISPPGGSIGNVRKALTDLGVLDPRFGWGELTAQGVALVSGPPSYVNLIESTVKGLPNAGGAQQAAVFRLRNASADDRTILYRDRQITLPGLATILRNLVTGQGRGGINNEALSAIAAPLLNAASMSTDGLGTSSQSGTGNGPIARITSGGQGAGASGNAGGGQGGSANTGAGDGASANRVRLPTVQSDPRLNALIIQDVPERMPIYRQLIEQLDVPTALIEIEAMIIDVNTERAKDLGINWGGRAGSTALGFGNLTSTPAAGTLSVVRGVAGSLVTPSSLVVDAGNYLVSQIRILETKGDARIQSRPSVMTMDNIGALLDLSETFYIRVQGERVATVTPVTAGTTLKVTPRTLIENGVRMVQLMIDIEDGQIQDRQIDTLPTVRRSSVSTQAVVRSDDTLLIAGHTQDQNIDSLNKIPLLGDIPGIGALFSNRSANVQRRERLFMIKPRIITLPPGQDMGETVVKPLPSPEAAPPVSATPLPAPAMAAVVVTPVAPAVVNAAPPAKPGFMLHMGGLAADLAKVVQARAARILDLPLEQLTLQADGALMRVQAGPFAQLDDAMAAARKIESSMNLQPRLVAVQTPGTAN